MLLQKEREKKTQRRRRIGRLTYCEGHGGDAADHDVDPGNFPGAEGTARRLRHNNLVGSTVKKPDLRLLIVGGVETSWPPPAGFTSMTMDRQIDWSRRRGALNIMSCANERGILTHRGRDRGRDRRYPAKNRKNGKRQFRPHFRRARIAQRSGDRRRPWRCGSRYSDPSMYTCATV